MRPAGRVVLCAGDTSFADEAIVKELRLLKHLRDGFMVLAPIYGIAAPDARGGFPRS
jgi:hypothetical protein